MIVFIASLSVSILTIVFNRFQAVSYDREFRRRIKSTTNGDEVAAEQPYGLSPAVVRSWFDQGLDLSANFPATVLTLVAFSELRIFENSFGVAFLIIIACAVSFLLAVFSRPRYASLAAPVGISLFSWAIFAANLVGVIILVASGGK